MGFLGLFNFAFICFDLLAWPLFALGYPLCASIRAIETNSNYHMRKLVTYWILFSMISLVELAFVKLIERVPLWPYIKLGTICLLVLPRFNGAHYCYKSLIQPYLSLNLEQVMKRLYKRQKVSVEKDNFLSVAERYVSENGTEALEKLIAGKGSRTGFVAEDIKAVAEVGQQEMPSMVKGPGTGFSVEKTKAVAEAEKKEMPRMVKPKGNEFNIVHEDINKMEQPEIKSPVPENSVKTMNPILLQAKKKTVETVEVKEMTKPPVPSVCTVEALAVKIPSEKVQKEWTCAVCQVKTPREADLNSHLTGKRHRTKCEELELLTKLKAGPSNPASKGAQDNQGSTKPSSKDGLSNDKVKNKRTRRSRSKSKAMEASKMQIIIAEHGQCISNAGAVTCMSETDYLSHLNGKKHLARVQEMAVYPAAVQQGWDYSAYPYNCNF